MGRREFAKRIADTIGGSTGGTGIVVGLYGAWGEGKTSLLEMVRDELTNRRVLSIDTLSFNPWYFRGQESLVLAFFSQVAAKLEARLGNSADEFKRVLQKYGSVLSALPVNVHGIDPGKVMITLADRLKESDLESLKKQLESLLDDRRIHLVVFMDDIDRLDRVEIASVLKLAKLVGGFSRITYVLAFDDEMVAQAVGHAYGGDDQAGRAFLEKIVQVPLRLPTVDRRTLLSLTLGEVDRALAMSDVGITPDEAQEFRRYFDPLFEARSRTLRVGKRYGNSLAFALPLLRGEVRPADMLLVEALRCFVAALHQALVPHSELLLGESSADRMGRRPQELREEQKKEWETMLLLASPAEREAAAEMLEHLFPRVARFTKNTHYGSEWLGKWAAQQRIAAPEYFPRYFQYAIPSDDVSDVRFRDLLAVLETGDARRSLELYDGLLRAGNADRLVQKLRLIESNLTSLAAGTLVQLLIERGGALPKPDAFFDFLMPQPQAVFLLTRALAVIPREERFARARAILTEVKNLAFAVECYRRMRPSDDGEKKDEGKEKDTEKEEKKTPLFTSDEMAQLEAVLRDRLSAAAVEAPFYLEDGRDAQMLLSAWAYLVGREATQEVITRRLQREPAEALRVLSALAGRPVSLDTGLSLPREINREQYNAISELIEPSLLIDALTRALPIDVARAREEDEFDDSLKEEVRLARRFVWLHRRVTDAAKSSLGQGSEQVGQEDPERDRVKPSEEDDESEDE